MFKTLLKTALIGSGFAGAMAFANDGGVVAIKVNDIRMREYKLEDGVEKEVRRIVKPNFKITFSGGEAAKLQKVLPSQISVITSMQPEIADQFAQSFKTLGIYSDKSPQVSSKVVTINCVDADLQSVGDEGRVKIVKKGQSECSIEIVGVDEGVYPEDYLGAIQTYAPSCQP